ncbi:MAG TPA: hypothetical protein VK961_11190 [Chthoniobacter sp.]|nr:hypothetical protein [Chthoniobacter sp.]
MSQQRRFFADIHDGTKRVWYTERLWELAAKLPVKQIPVESIEALDQVAWFGNAQPTCRHVTEHARRIYEASLEYPIILSAEGWVMDGMHRLCKALLLKNETIEAVQFPANPEPDESVAVP